MTSSTIWNRSPSSSPNSRQGSWSETGTSAAHRRAADRCREQPPGLQPVQHREVVHLAVDVEVLAADHPERRLRELACDLGRRVGGGLAEGLRQQRVAGEDRVGLAEARPHAGAAAPDVVVVERRQVVVDERERVDELERCGRREHVLDVGARRLSRRQADHRAAPACRPPRSRSGRLRRDRRARERARCRRGTASTSSRSWSGVLTSASNSCFARSISACASRASRAISSRSSSAASGSSVCSSFARAASSCASSCSAF